MVFAYMHLDQMSKHYQKYQDSLDIIDAGISLLGTDERRHCREIAIF